MYAQLHRNSKGMGGKRVIKRVISITDLFARYFEMFQFLFCEKWLEYFVLIRGFTKKKKKRIHYKYDAQFLKDSFFVLQEENKTSSMFLRCFVMRHEQQPARNTEQTACKWWTLRSVFVFKYKNTLEVTLIRKFISYNSVLLFYHFIIYSSIHVYSLSINI